MNRKERRATRYREQKALKRATGGGLGQTQQEPIPTIIEISDGDSLRVYREEPDGAWTPLDPDTYEPTRKAQAAPGR